MGKNLSRCFRGYFSWLSCDTERWLSCLKVNHQATTWLNMGWLLVFVVLSCLFFIGCSLKTLLIYIFLVSISYGFTYLFIINKWDLDGLFEEIFKAVELFGFGAPHRLENRIGYSSFYSNGSFNSLEEVPKALEEGFKKLIDNIIRDFIRTWYENVGEGKLFISETRDSLEMLCLEGYKRGSQIDSHYLTEQVIVVFHGHLERFNKAMAIVKAKDPKLRLSISSSQLLCQTYESQLCSKPPSLSSSAAELSYLRNVVDSLLAAMIPKDTFSCNTGRFILREILTVQVVKPLVELLTDPDWICQAVIEILRKQNEGDEESTFTAKEEHDSLATEDHCDSLSCTNEPHAAGKVNLPLLGEKTTAIDVQRTATKQIVSRKESEESVEDIGERIEITAPGACDFHWSVSTERQPPVGESQHDSGDSFLVISVDESRENSTEDLNQGRSNWSTEVVPPSSVEDSKENSSSDQSNGDNNWSIEAVSPHSIESMTSSSLSSSWMVCPSSEDEPFRRKSFEEMKGHLSDVESNGALHSWKEMTMPCCHQFDASGDSYRPLSLVAQKGSSDEESDETGDASCLRVATRRFSLPESVNKTEADRNLSRSVSVPCNLSLADYDNLDMEGFCTPRSPGKICSPHIYRGSFCSSSDSFKSISSEEDILDLYIERGEEALEETDDFYSSIDGAQNFGVVTKKSTKSKITKQVSFEECQGKHLSSAVAKEVAASECAFPSSSQENSSPKKAILRKKNGSSELDSIKESSWETTDRDNLVDDPSTGWKRLRLGFGGQSSDSSISDAFITASKKLVSNFKPPFKFDSCSSNSTKSSEASISSGGESLDHSSANQREISPQGASLDVGRGRAATYSSSGVRRLSRSDAVVEESMDNSDTDTWYGTPRDEWTQEALGVSYRGKDGVDSSIMRVKRMHPSELISIPITFVALETTWEPGRNKYTLYKIEVSYQFCDIYAKCSIYIHVLTVQSPF